MAPRRSGTVAGWQKERSHGNIPAQGGLRHLLPMPAVSLWALRPWAQANADLGVPVHCVLPQLTLPNRFLPFLPSLLPGEGQTLLPHRAPWDVPASPSASPGPWCPVLGSDLQPGALLFLLQLPHGLCSQHLHEPRRHPQPGAPCRWCQREGPVPPGQGQVAALLPQDQEGGWLALLQD